MNQKGFSLVELLIVAAGIGGLAVVGMQIAKTQLKTQTKSIFDSDALLTTNEIVGILSDPNKCLNTLGGKNAVSTSNGINAINGNRYYSIASGSSPNDGYGNSNLKISNYTLSSTSAEVGQNISYLNINFAKKSLLKTNSADDILTKKIKLYVEVDASNNITKCRSIAAATTDIWTRGSGSTIFYSGGNVGIGTTNPQVSFQVAGAIGPGDESQATSCNAATEGSMRYNKSLRQMQFCGSEAGPPVSYSWKAMGGNGYSSINVRTASRNAWRWPSITAVCNSDEKALGGGGSCSGGSGFNFIPSTLPSGNGWYVSCDTPNNQSVTVIAYVICAK